MKLPPPERPPHRPGSGNESLSRARQLREEVRKMHDLALAQTSREVREGSAFLDKIAGMLDDKVAAELLAQQLGTDDPKDIYTYRYIKEIGLFLVVDTFSPQRHELGDIVIEAGDKILQLHIPPRKIPDGETNQLFTELTESLQLLSNYISFHDLKPKFITGCTYNPLVRIAQRRYGFSATFLNIPKEWTDHVRKVFKRYVDSKKEPDIGFIYISIKEFKKRFPPRRSE